MTVGRNDPCPCGSKKKYKKCCFIARRHKPLKASILSSGASHNKIASLFQKGAVKSQKQEREFSSIKDKVSLSS